ncbi:MAG: hypothetical protein WCS94_02950 [Verrucomicrobiota bacterium]
MLLQRINWFWRRFTAQIAALSLLGSLISAPAQTLYDASPGTLPEAQGWSYGVIDFGTIKTMAGNSVLLDTSTSTFTSAGWSRAAAPPLDRIRGFTLLFTARLNAETHNNGNRAGFSVIVLGSDTNGIELAFWTNNIFAQSGPPSLFTHAEDAAFTTTGSFVEYALTLGATNYVLRANGTPVLTGPVRDYTSFSGPVNPYRTPNFIFFGDDTTSASASVNARLLALVRPPWLTAHPGGVVSWPGISNVNYRVQTSSNLVTWTESGVATSPTESITYTNPATRSAQFFRVAYP